MLSCAAAIWANELVPRLRATAYELTLLQARAIERDLLPWGTPFLHHLEEAATVNTRLPTAEKRPPPVDRGLPTAEKRPPPGILRVEASEILFSTPIPSFAS